MRRSVVVAVVAGLIAFGIGVAPPASAAVVTCGQTITTNTVLTADVGPCPGDGIVVGANNITLNLNGRRVLGNADQGAGGQFAGIVLQDRSGVTVQGRGTVSGFEAGVMINRGNANTVSGVTIQDNVGVLDIEIAELGDGIIAFSSAGNRILNNTVTRNGPFDGIGVLGFGSDNNVIQGNSVYDQYFTGEAGEQSFGVGIITSPIITFPSPTPGTSVFNNQILNNKVFRNPNSGISNVSSVGVLVRGNTVAHNGLLNTSPGNGIGARANQLATQIINARIEANIIRGNGGIGVDIFSYGNQVLNNDVSLNSRGISRGPSSPFQRTSTGPEPRRKPSIVTLDPAAPAPLGRTDTMGWGTQAQASPAYPTAIANGSARNGKASRSPLLGRTDIVGGLRYPGPIAQVPMLSRPIPGWPGSCDEGVRT